MTVWKAIKQSNTKPGDFILIAGAGGPSRLPHLTRSDWLTARLAGGLGHLAVQYAAAMSLRVIAVDTGAAKEALCRSYGAEFFVDFKTTKNLVADIKAAAGGIGPHAAILASSSGEAYNEALEYLRFVS